MVDEEARQLMLIERVCADAYHCSRGHVHYRYSKHFQWPLHLLVAKRRRGRRRYGRW